MKDRFDPAAKLALHPQFSAYLRGERIYPVGLEVSPSGVCQASCPFCPFANTGELGAHRNVFIRTAAMLSVLDQCVSLGIKAVSWTGGGDPALHHDIGRFVEKGHHLGLSQGMFTNALATPRFEAAYLDWVRVTMTDRTPRPEYVKALRGARTLGIAFNYTGVKDVPYLEDTLALAEVVGADYVQLRPALPFHGQTVDLEPPGVKHPLLFVTDYKFEDARRKHGYARCEGYHFVPFLWEDGNLDVCAYMRKHEGYTLGNVYEDALSTILDRAPPSVPVDGQCQVCCKNHEINKAVHRGRALLDVNFP
jgi:MoaA/NifB/PqqE/SkfB family radical SAM enzyme